MNETLISRPTFYEALGVDPAASVAEIEQAFARRISMFTPSAFGNVTQFGIAYQTLRDPIRREQYDRSIGVEPRPRKGLPSLQPGQVMFIAAQHREPSAPLLAEQIIVEQPRAAEPPPPPASRAPATTDQIQTELLYRDILARRADAAQPGDVAVDWKRTGIAVGGIIAAVAALGAWLGSQAGSDVEAKNLEAVSVPLPPAKANEEAVAPSVLNVPDDIVQAPPTSGRRYAVVRRTPAPRSSDPLAAVPETVPSDPAPAAGEVWNSGAAVPPPVTDLPAAMPLSDNTVARTLQRIGYSCGSVESTSAAGGGAFRVNCTSGHSYQATPVRGRYRFRKI